MLPQVINDPGDIPLKVDFKCGVIYFIYSRCGFPVQLRKAPAKIPLIQQTVKVPESVLRIFPCPFCYPPQ
jgi:hypothetical protein